MCWHSTLHALNINVLPLGRGIIGYPPGENNPPDIANVCQSYNPNHQK